GHRGGHPAPRNAARGGRARRGRPRLRQHRSRPRPDVAGPARVRGRRGPGRKVSGMAHEVTLSRRVAAPPEAVWEVLTDLDQAARRLTQVTDLHVISDGPYAVGTRWRETRRMMGSS